MKREIIYIDEELCDGCGDCIPNCHEGALQLIDGKARLISDLMCDGLGACIGHCPQGAITMEKREAQAYNETEVIRQMAGKGKNTVTAHLQHLLDHNEVGYLKEGVTWLKHHEDKLDFDLNQVIQVIHGRKEESKQVSISSLAVESGESACGCPGSMSREIQRPESISASITGQVSELRQWPVQFHLINPSAGYFQGADLLLAADCTAYAIPDFHSRYLKGKSLVIGCPKLDAAQENYLQKLVLLIDQAKINTIHVLVMEVPCCGGLLRLAEKAVSIADRKVPLKATVIHTTGEPRSETWL